MQTLSKEQFEKLYGTQVVSQFKNLKPSGENGFLSETVQDIKQTGGNLLNTAKTTLAKQKQSLDASVNGEQGLLAGFGQAFGAGAGGIAQGIGDIFTGAVKTVLPQEAEDSLKSGVKTAATPIVQSDFIQSLMAKYEGLDDKQKRDVDALLGVGSLVTEFVGGGLIKKPLQQGVKAGRETATNVVKAGADIAISATQRMKPLIDTTGSVINTTGSALKMAGEGISKIPGRVAANVAEKQAVEQSIKSLPVESAQRAVREGVDLNDVKFFSEIPKLQKTPVKKLIQAVQDFASGKSKTDPIEAVGKPLIDRINTVKSLQNKVGNELGKAADTLGDIASDEAFLPIYDSLKGVRGLEGLKIADDGVNFDFSDTVLASAETASDRNAIQSIFNEATKAGTGKQKHLLRQELREVLGGKKAGGVQLTGTQENAYEAIRQGLSNVLDTKNPVYKKLNTQYAQISEPLSKLAKALRIGKETDIDILNMKGGLLARRLTSNAVSKPEIKSLLNAIDNLTAKKGVTRTSLETLQDTVNILGKYYDIAPKTGFQNLVTEGVSNTGVKDFITGTLRDIGGKTNATRKKALEDALKDLLN